MTKNPHTVTLTVKVDANNQPVGHSFTPDPLYVEEGYTDKIYWDQGSSNFAFAALVFDGPNPFLNIVVKDTEITAIDTHTTSKFDHSYSILIRIGTQYFRLANMVHGPGPIIHNN